MCLVESYVREAPNRPKNEYLFDVVTKDRVYELKSRTQMEMSTWISDLRKRSLLDLENDDFDEVQVWDSATRACM